MNIKQAEEFGRMMGKMASVKTLITAPLAMAAAGAGGTALYDYLRGNKKNKLRRAMLGGLASGLASYGLRTGLANLKSNPKIKLTDEEFNSAGGDLNKLQDLLDDKKSIAGLEVPTSRTASGRNLSSEHANYKQGPFLKTKKFEWNNVNHVPGFYYPPSTPGGQPKFINSSMKDDKGNNYPS